MGYRTNVYVDGYNLYYGLLKDQPKRKWLNLLALAQLKRRGDTIHRIRYFTAPVNGDRDPDEPQRQQTYLRALRTIPNLTVHLGQFQKNTVYRPLVSSRNPRKPEFAQVYEYEEKGSDVNLATMLLCDASDSDFEQAIVISNDSDLALPIQLVHTKFKLKIGVLSPRPNVTGKLKNAANFCGALRWGSIEACQFPDVVHDAKGMMITKPPHW